MRNTKGFLAGFAFILVALLFSEASNGQAYEYPLKVSFNKRYLVDRNNVPFFMSGDAAWSLIVQPDKEDAIHYLEDRKKKGFNALLVNLIDHAFCTNPPANYYGDRPFTGRVFATPNEDYFRHADFVIRQAAKRGMVLLLSPLYLGYGCGQEGWCSEVKKASLDDMRVWGQFLGNRYKNFDNIIWCMGGDADPTPVKDKIQQFQRGIRQNQVPYLFTSHNQPGSFAVTPWAKETWLTINSVYSYQSALHREYKTAYLHKPTMPFFLLEAAYENEHQTSLQRLKSQAYGAVLSGGFGHIFGNCPIWHYGASPDWCGIADWKSQLDSPGSVCMMHLQALFRSRAWHQLVPDFQHELLTSGSGLWGRIFDDRGKAIAAITKNNTTMIAYLPSKQKIKIDMSKISGPLANCWWYRTFDGSATSIGSYPTSGIRLFEPPSNEDWVIVIDDASLKLPPPGQGIFFHH